MIFLTGKNSHYLILIEVHIIGTFLVIMREMSSDKVVSTLNGSFW